MGTDSAGEYAISGLEAGSWNVDFGTERVGMGLLETSYEHDPVVLGANTHAEGIDAMLGAGGEISGVVSAAQTGEPLPGILVCLVESPTKRSPHCTETGTDGSYDFEGLMSGSYMVAFSPDGEEIRGALVREAEEETGEVLSRRTATRPSGGSPEEVSPRPTPIALTAPQTIGGIDGSIGPAQNWKLVSERVVDPPAIPPAPVVWEPNAPPTRPTATKPVIATKPAKKPKALKCKRGFVKRKAHGSALCVKRPEVVRHAKKKRGKHAA